LYEFIDLCVDACVCVCVCVCVCACVCMWVLESNNSTLMSSLNTIRMITHIFTQTNSILCPRVVYVQYVDVCECVCLCGMCIPMI
jgi:hypothetical protein